MNWHRVIAVIVALAALMAVPVRASMPVHGHAAMGHAAMAATAAAVSDGHHAGAAHDEHAAHGTTCPLHGDLSAQIAADHQASHPANPGGPTVPPDCCTIGCAALALPIKLPMLPAAVPASFKVRVGDHRGPAGGPGPLLRPPRV